VNISGAGAGQAIGTTVTLTDGPSEPSWWAPVAQERGVPAIWPPTCTTTETGTTTPSCTLVVPPATWAANIDLSTANPLDPTYVSGTDSQQGSKVVDLNPGDNKSVSFAVKGAPTLTVNISGGGAGASIG